jgi:hypothetical protein
MGNEEILLHFRHIHISVYVNMAWVWATAWQECFRFGWAVSLAGRNRTERTMEDRKVKQSAEDKHSCHAVARQSEKSRQNCLRK